MFSRSALRGVFDVQRTASQSLISSFISQLPRRACLHQASTSTQFQATPHEIPPQSVPSASPSSQPSQPSQQSQTASTKLPSASDSEFIPQTRNHIPREKLPVKPSFTEPLKISKSLAKMLPYLTTQRPHYISAHLHARPYLLTEGDHLRLPFKMPQVKPGDILRFNRASLIGSRDYTLKGAPYIDERMYECRVRVIGVDAEPLRIKEKTKRRQRHVQHIKSKHKYTLMRVMEVKVKTLEELLEEGAQIVEDGEGDPKIESKN
ncbi:hypothetical protein VTN77DRAFT_1062 [Rasamsonia byssochlamydoides]|uniref:mitochondrial 54S ribosomal protein bL21m n=1 Tax=Rasamsonia byssochlamydoides TaxID=89139 RepID=UPI00374481EE